MGIRIHSYALDTDRAHEWGSMSVWETLSIYAAESRPTDRPLRIGQYEATNIHGVTHLGKKVFLPESELLRTPLEQVLRSDIEPHTLHWALDAFARIREQWVRTITAGHRRWWIGSVLEAAAENLGTQSASYQALDFHFARLLRGWGCGTPMLTRDEPPSAVMPFSPASDCDFRMSIWSESDLLVVATALEELMATEPRFAPPRGPVGIAPEGEDEWVAWVQENVRAWLRVVEAPPFPHVVCVSFIG